MRKMLRSRWLWTLMAISASPGLIAWLLGVSLIASIALAGVMMGVSFWPRECSARTDGAYRGLVAEFG